MSLYSLFCGEPYFFDDYIKQNPDIGRSIIANAAIQRFHIGSDTKAIALLTNILPEQTAEFHGWVHPEYRSGYRNQKQVREWAYYAVELAFDRHKVDSLTAWICAANEPAIRLVSNIGFKQRCSLSKIRKYNGEYLATLIWEKLK